ncbi:hypothetical protein HDU99_003522 [Rhizoclosmatium hyalinum]|nr:hypothetical protein HDU99_003522 [Rhizoclosmatium hyalinum]
MLGGSLVTGVQCKVTGPSGDIRKCELTENHQSSWAALEQELKTLHGISGPITVHYLDEDNDLIMIDSDAELTTLLKWVIHTKATTIKMTVTPAFAGGFDQYNSTNSMASYRTQDSFSGVIPAPDGSMNSTDSWRFRPESFHNRDSQGSVSYQNRPLSQAMEYNSQASVTSDYNQQLDRLHHDISSDGAKNLPESTSILRQAQYKAAIEANNAARKAFEESKQAARAQREQIKNARRAGGDNLPAYE